MASKVKQLIDEFFPGFANDQIVVGLVNVGISVINCTLAVNTVRTDAQIIASPPNTGSGVQACGPVVHSLGTAPTVVIPVLTGAPSGLGYGIGFQLVTCDNSAIYYRAASWTGAAPVGAGVQIVAIR